MLTQREQDTHILEIREKHDLMYSEWGLDKEADRYGEEEIPTGELGGEIQQAEVPTIGNVPQG